MKYCDSISSIGGEGIPSRDHTREGEQRAEETTCGFKMTKSRGKCSSIQNLS